jgi:class 3 adenylate cyclase
MAMLDYVSDTITAAGGSVLRYAGDAILTEFQHPENRAERIMLRFELF